MAEKPSEHEEAYFARKELERRQKIAAEQEKQVQDKERQRLKELHYMRCPKCGMQLVEIDYKSIKIDECANCKGVWLDSRELEAVVEMEQAERSGFGKLFGLFK